MLQLVSIGKDFNIEHERHIVLEEVDLTFRSKEFVAILGKSGAGKTTLLNIIAGFTEPTSGKILFKGENINLFSDHAWDSYRNRTIGFVFQDYSLINHLTVFENVRIAMEIGGVDLKTADEKTEELLAKFGLTDKMDSYPRELSGGEQQRAVLARALANDPEILLCDEPTASLDDKAAQEIIRMLKEEAKSRLVIMVTHDTGYAEQNVDRIIWLENGLVREDTRPWSPEEEPETYEARPTKISLIAGIRYAAKSLKSTSFRRVFMGLGYAVGILCISFAFNMSTGFDDSISSFESRISTDNPIIINDGTIVVGRDRIIPLKDEVLEDEVPEDRYADAVVAHDMSLNSVEKENVIEKSYLDQLTRLDEDDVSGIGYIQKTVLHLIRYNEEGFRLPLDIEPEATEEQDIKLSVYPVTPSGDIKPFLEENYELLSGSYPEKATDICLVVDEHGQVDTDLLQKIGYDIEVHEPLAYSDLVGATFMLVDNDDYYRVNGEGLYEVSDDYEGMLESEKSIPVTLVGIIRPNEGGKDILKTGLVYSSELCTMAAEKARSSQMAVAQRRSDKDIFTGALVDNDKAKGLAESISGEQFPSRIVIYPRNFNSKQRILSFLDDYNARCTTRLEQVYYSDYSDSMTRNAESMLKGVKIALRTIAIIASFNCFFIMFVMVSDIVRSSRKEIGILKALGVYKYDISMIYFIEALMIGAFSGMVGVCASFLLTYPVNLLLYKTTGVPEILVFDMKTGIFLVVFSILLTITSGLIPALRTSREEARKLLST